jgi:hypothetical protein
MPCSPHNLAASLTALSVIIQSCKIEQSQHVDTTSRVGAGLAWTVGPDDLTTSGRLEAVPRVDF